MSEKLKIYTMLCFILVAFTGIMTFSMIVKTQKIYQQGLEIDDLKKEIKHLKKEMKIDSITLETLNKGYYELWEENQIFSSMLSEIETTEQGHEKLKKSWNKHNQR